LVLEGAQAGVSWIAILRKRDAFAGFDRERLARVDAPTVSRLLLSPGIVGNRQKIESAGANARAALKVQDAAKSVSDQVELRASSRKRGQPPRRRREYKYLPPVPGPSRMAFSA
jgi:3-methyladenine DNA glycosylase Tag